MVIYSIHTQPIIRDNVMLEKPIFREEQKENIKVAKTAVMIRNAYRFGQGLGFVVHGPRGVGKTTWSVKVAARCIGTVEKPDFNGVKNWLIFTPQEFCNLINKTYNTQIVLVWDDAGYWINRLFWYEQFVREALRYMTLQRTQFTAIIFSTPSLTLIPNKILQLEDVYRVKIIKLKSDFENSKRPRMAFVKRPWYSDDLKKHGVSLDYPESFSGLMPDDFFQWYQPVRQKYVMMAAKRIQDTLKKAKDVGMKAGLEELEDEIGKTIPSVEDVKKMGEVNDQHS